jgi:hypothetical protein
MRKIYSRRDFLRFAGLGATASILAACSGSGASRLPTVTPAPTNPPATATPVSAAAASDLAPVSEEAAAAQAEIVVGDVVDFVLSSEEWPGMFGSVTMKLHESFFDGDMAYHIQTDANDPTFAQENKLVFVPLLGALLQNEEATSVYYTFENGVNEQQPVLSTIPGQDDFSPAMHVYNVTFTGSPTLLDSAEAVQAAEADGDVTIADTGLVVNCPIIKWPGGSLDVDTALEATLGDGQLFSEPDTNKLEVTLKLHQCYPGSRYILTDTSTADMAPMMHVPASPPTLAMLEAGATDEIWIFHNGIEGSGVMGFQPAIFDHKATNPAWSPFWDHRALEWNEGVEARVLTSSDEIRAAIEAGDVTEYMGVKPSHPNGFVVNCPAPILAPNTFAA